MMFHPRVRRDRRHDGELRFWRSFDESYVFVLQNALIPNGLHPFRNKVSRAPDTSACLVSRKLD
jgi:hypothetical protein